MWKEWEMKNWQREQMPKRWRGKEARKTDIAMEDCIKSELERVDEEWRKEQEIEVRGRKTQWKWKSSSSHPKDSDAKKRKQWNVTLV